MKSGQRGVFEKVPGSGIWWARYFDANGRKRREKAGTKSMAMALYRKRKVEIAQGKKLPENIRHRSVPFSELCEDAVAYAREHHQTERKRDYRADRIIELLGNRPADGISPADIDRELSRVARERGWAPASYNRFKAFISLAFRLGIENGKVQNNPARVVRRRREDNGRIRWLSTEEESRLRTIIQADYPAELPAFDLALHTGMRRSEQYHLTWNCIDIPRRQLTIPRSKHGGVRYIPLNDTALGAVLELRKRGSGDGPVMVAGHGGHGVAKGQPVKSPRMWFASACAKAGVHEFTWHCLRHTYASRLIMAGIGLRDVQELMGHKTIAMTCRYAHLAPSHQLAAVRRLDGWMLVGGKVQEPSDPKTDTGAQMAHAPGSGAMDQVFVNKVVS